MTLHSVETRLCAGAALVLAAGALFYVCARGAHPLTTVPAVWGGSLPTLLHSAAFALLALAVTAPWPRLAPWVCAGWLAVEAGFELFQLESVARIANVAGPETPWLRAFLAGTFDPADLLAAVAGVLLALMIAAPTAARADRAR